MYSINSIEIVGVLLASMGLTVEVSYRLGRRYEHAAGESYRSQVNAVQASLPGVLALIIALPVVTCVMIAMIAPRIFIIIDLDRPRRGDSLSLTIWYTFFIILPSPPSGRLLTG